LYYYNVHDIIRIKSEINLQELEYFASNEFGDPDITLMIRSFSKDHDMSKFRATRKLMTDNFESGGSQYTIKYTEHFGSSGAQFQIQFNGSKIEVSINELISKSKHVTYVNLIEPILRFLFLSKEYILLHSACMSSPNGQGFFLSAPPDTGKTTTVIKCVKQGYYFLSDDMTIIKLPNNALSFPKSMTISAHTYRTAVEAQSSSQNGENDTNDKKGMRIRSLIHSKTGRSLMHKLADHNVPIFTINTIGQSRIKPPKYHISDIIKDAKIIDKTTINSLFFLEKGSDGEKVEEMERISVEHALKRAIENSDDAFLFPPYSDLIKYIRIESKTAYDLLEAEKKMMEELLSSIDCYILKSSGRKWSEMIFDKFSK
jgi:dolichol-phosphate mannosyltransferase